jgi:hypothetical protein
MPIDFIIKTGDKIKINIPPPTVVPSVQSPLPLIGSAKASLVDNMAACVEGDETPKALLSPQPYTEPPFVTPGTGTITIKIAATNKSAATKDDSKSLLLKGSTFQVEFQVVSPAIDPTTGTPDPKLKKQGTAQFLTDNTFAKAE